MTEEQKRAFAKFKSKHFAAVQTDTLLGAEDNDADRFFQLERKAKLFWQQAAEAEQEFLALLS